MAGLRRLSVRPGGTDHRTVTGCPILTVPARRGNAILACFAPWPVTTGRMLRARRASAAPRQKMPAPPRRRRPGSALRKPEEQTSELKSLMRPSYDVFCLKNKNNVLPQLNYTHLTNKHNIQKLSN